MTCCAAPCTHAGRVVVVDGQTRAAFLLRLAIARTEHRSRRSRAEGHAGAELPEVEVVRRGLEGHVLDRRIEAVEVLHPRPVRRHLAGPEDFAASLIGHSFTAARRRGKYLWLPLDNGDAL